MVQLVYQWFEFSPPTGQHKKNCKFLVLCLVIHEESHPIYSTSEIRSIITKKSLTIHIGSPFVFLFCALLIVRGRGRQAPDHPERTLYESLQFLVMSHD
jgi:hypothetical protein